MGTGPLPAEVLGKLQTRAWPGNVRELRNVVHAFSVLGTLPEPQEDVGSDGFIERFASQPLPYAELKEDLVARFTRAYVQALMARAGGNQSAAAKMAGLDRSYLGRLVAKYQKP